MPRAKPGELLRFAKQAAVSETDECIIWPFGTSNTGYGVMSYNGRQRSAHRVVLMLRSSSDEKNLFACHGPCNNKKCINPRHLSWQTSEQNVRDKVRDGTTTRGKRRKKRSKELIKAICLDPLGGGKASKKYGIPANNIREMRTRKRYSQYLSQRAENVKKEKAKEQQAKRQGRRA